MTTKKSPWYHQIRWRLTLSYGLVIFFVVLAVEFLFLTVSAYYLYTKNPDVGATRTLLDEMWQLVKDDIIIFPLLLVVGHAISRQFSLRIDNLLHVVNQWTDGQYHVRVQDDSADEIGVLSRQLSEMADQLQKTVETEQALAAARERERFAQDLHDTIKQQVFALQMELSAVRNLLVTDPKSAGELLDEALDHSRQVQIEVNSLINRLPPAGLEHKTLGVVVREYVDRMNLTDIEIEVNVIGDRDQPIEVEEALFRVLQGALSNVTRHSHAKSAKVVLEQNEEGVLLRITDDGVGFDVFEPRMHEFGLESMRARMAESGGTLVIESQPGEGTVLTAQAPVQTESTTAA